MIYYFRVCKQTNVYAGIWFYDERGNLRVRLEWGTGTIYYRIKQEIFANINVWTNI
jgi:hypothetical protein